MRGPLLTRLKACLADYDAQSLRSISSDQLRSDLQIAQLTPKKPQLTSFDKNTFCDTILWNYFERMRQLAEEHHQDDPKLVTIERLQLLCDALWECPSPLKTEESARRNKEIELTLTYLLHCSKFIVIIDPAMSDITSITHTEWFVDVVIERLFFFDRHFSPLKLLHIWSPSDQSPAHDADIFPIRLLKSSAFRENLARILENFEHEVLYAARKNGDWSFGNILHHLDSACLYYCAQPGNVLRGYACLSGIAVTDRFSGVQVREPSASMQMYFLTLLCHLLSDFVLRIVGNKNLNYSPPVDESGSDSATVCDAPENSVSSGVASSSAKPAQPHEISDEFGRAMEVVLFCRRLDWTEVDSDDAELISVAQAVVARFLQSSFSSLLSADSGVFTDNERSIVENRYTLAGSRFRRRDTTSGMFGVDVNDDAFYISQFCPFVAE